MTTTTPDEYKAMLVECLTTSGTAEYDPATHLSIAELEESVISSGLPMPIVRLPEHYLRGTKWFTNRGDVELCNCGAMWPCPLAIVIPPVVMIEEFDSDPYADVRAYWDSKNAPLHVDNSE